MKKSLNYWREIEDKTGRKILTKNEDMLVFGDKDNQEILGYIKVCEEC